MNFTSPINEVKSLIKHRWKRSSHFILFHLFLKKRKMELCRPRDLGFCARQVLSGWFFLFQKNDAPRGELKWKRCRPRGLAFCDIGLETVGISFVSFNKRCTTGVTVEGATAKSNGPGIGRSTPGHNQEPQQRDQHFEGPLI
jgi:hypothetical protein